MDMARFFVSVVLFLLSAGACNYREDKVSFKDPALGPEPTPTGEPSPTSTPPPKEWFTALQKTVFNPKCVECHRPGNAKGDVLLTDYKSVMESDPPIVVAFKPNSSSLYKCIVHPDPDKRMPKGQPSLSEQECQTIFNWIKKGAPEKNPDADVEEFLEN